MTRPALLDALEVPDAPVELAALLIAQDFTPETNVEARLRELDTLGEDLRDAVRRRPSHPHRALSQWFSSAGFRGEREHYYDPRNSYLGHVLDTRRGLPITLSVVMVAVARRAGMHMDGVGFPGHFLVRSGDAFFDPFDAGRQIDATDLATFARRVHGDGVEVHPDWLEPVTTRQIATRMLLNLKRAHLKRGDHSRVLVACDRLVDLTGAIEHRRDRGWVMLKLGAASAAADDLAAYLEAHPNAPDAAAVRDALAQARASDRSMS